MSRQEESLTRRQDLPVTDTGSQKEKRTSDYKNYIRLWFRWKSGNGMQRNCRGLSLRNVSAAVYDGKKKLYEDFGEMLFTHYGVSGPLMLSASSVIGKRLSEKELRLVIDLKPALTAEQLDARVLREFEEHKKQTV